MSNVVEVKQVSKIINGITILEKIDLTLEEGTITGLVGRNGSGKTVLMKCILGFLKINEGKITVFGKEIGKDIEFAQDTGFIIENPGFLPFYTGYENLKFLYGIRNKQDTQRIREILEIVGLDPDSKKKTGKYSMGMKQRLGIAQAIMEKPKLIILDEPFNGLDQQGVLEIRELLLDLKKQGATILLASHNQEDIDTLCDSVYRMELGRIKDTRQTGTVNRIPQG